MGSDSVSDTGKQLVKELRIIWDDRNFILGAMSNAGSKKAWEKMLDYIHMARRMGDEVTSDDILILSIKLGEEET